MEKKDEVLLLSQKLTEAKLNLKMMKWAFENTENMSEEKANAFLDEKLRLDRLIEALEKRLKEFEE